MIGHAGHWTANAGNSYAQLALECGNRESMALNLLVMAMKRLNESICIFEFAGLYPHTSTLDTHGVISFREKIMNVSGCEVVRLWLA